MTTKGWIGIGLISAGIGLISTGILEITRLIEEIRKTKEKEEKEKRAFEAKIVKDVYGGIYDTLIEAQNKKVSEAG